MTAKPGLATTLDEAVSQVYHLLYGTDLSYIPELDTYRTVAHLLNKALRLNALEKEWSYYSSVEDLGPVPIGRSSVEIPVTLRPRVINDDAVRLVDPKQENFIVEWAYFLPRDALHKYNHRHGELRCAVTNTTLHFSHPFGRRQEGLHIQIPVMREPRMLEIPAKLEYVEDLTTPASPPPVTMMLRDYDDPDVVVEVQVVPTTPPYYELVPEEVLDIVAPGDPDVREQLIDFPYPDLICLRASFLLAQSDPVLQPRVQTLEAQFKDLMYQVIERDDRNTDTPYQNDFFVPVANDLYGDYSWHDHPHADGRRFN